MRLSLPSRRRRGALPLETAVLGAALTLTISAGVSDPDGMRQGAQHVRAQLGINVRSTAKAIGVSVPELPVVKLVLPADVADPWSAEAEAEAEAYAAEVNVPGPVLAPPSSVTEVVSDGVADPSRQRLNAAPSDWGSNPWGDEASDAR